MAELAGTFARLEQEQKGIALGQGHATCNQHSEDRSKLAAELTFRSFPGSIAKLLHVAPAVMAFPGYTPDEFLALDKPHVVHSDHAHHERQRWRRLCHALQAQEWE